MKARAATKEDVTVKVTLRENGTAEFHFVDGGVVDSLTLQVRGGQREILKMLGNWNME